MSINYTCIVNFVRFVIVVLGLYREMSLFKEMHSNIFKSKIISVIFLNHCDSSQVEMSKTVTTPKPSLPISTSGPKDTSKEMATKLI